MFSRLLIGVIVLQLLLGSIPIAALAQTSSQDQANLQQMASLISSLQGIFNALKAKVQAFKGGSAVQTAQAQTADITSGLVGHWKFDEGSGTTAADSSGNNNTGTLTNGPTWTTGKIGGAINLDGVDDYVRVPDSSTLDVSSATAFGGWAYNASAGWNMLAKEGTNFGYLLQARTDSQQISCAPSITTGSPVTYPVTSFGGGLNEFTNVWAHIFCVYDGANLKLYINGIERNSRAASGSITTNTDALNLGARNGVSTFRGILDDMRIYNRALSASDVQALHALGSGSPPLTDTTAPTVSITAPTSGSTVSGSLVTVSANASDNVGVVGVQFKLDGANLGSEDIASPYSITWNSTIVSNGSHTLTAVARDAAGNQTNSSGVPVTVNNTAPPADTQAPSTPTGLTATAVSSSQINLSWTASTDNVGVTGYRIYRGGTQITTVTGTSYQNTGLSPSTSYSYTVAAYDAAGNVSAQSSSASATTQTVPTGASQLQQAAASLQPGQSLRLTTSNLASVNYGVSDPISTWTGSGVWDAAAREASFIAKDHASTGFYRIVYSESSNTWSRDPSLSSALAPPNYPVGHSYDGNTINHANGDLYLRPFNSGIVHKRDGATKSWSTLPLVVGSYDIAESISWWDGRGLIFSDVYGVRLFNGSSWSTLVPGSAISGIGYHSLGEYQPTASIFVFGGGNAGTTKLYRLTSNNTLTLLNAAPLALGNGENTQGHLVYDPASSKFIACSRASVNWYSFDAVADVWTSLAPVSGTPSTPASGAPNMRCFAAVAIPIPTYGVIMFVESTNGVWLYKHSSGGTPPPSDTTVPTTSVTAPTAGTTVVNTVTISANASDNVGVTNVEFLVDGVVKGSDSSSPYSYSWDTTNGGTHACGGAHTHALVVRAYDAVGNVGTSANIVVNMNNPSYCTTPPPAFLPAFPGAEGFGTETRGGRGGRVIVVTNLNGSGPGSFREAMLATGPRIIVFRVSGVIDLGGDILLSEANSNVTVLGQSSPGGITFINGAITNYQTNFHDAIFRFIRIRAQAGDTLAFNPVYNLVVDHSDFSGGSDETFDLDNTHDVTVQWSTISNSMSGPGSQNYGALIAYRPTNNISLHHNFQAHHGGRCGAQLHWSGSNPIPATGVNLDLRNNVFYNCGFQQIYRADLPPTEGTNYNLMGNYAKSGPNTPSGSMLFGLGGTIYMNDNLYPGQSIMSIYSNPTYLSQPHPFPSITTTSALQAYNDVLAKAGSWPRDAMTTRTINETNAGTGTMGKLDDPLNTATGPTPPADADLDGIADSWELSHGLSPSNPLDSAQLHASGYAHIEVYLNEIAQQIIPGGTPPPTLVGDLNADRTVNALDWSIMNGAWNTAAQPSDINADGIVNSIDFSLLNANWGRTI